MSHASEYVQREEKVSAPNYAPLPVVLQKGKGVWLWDLDGKKYIDMMSAYSAVSHGHAHPRLLKVLHDQAATLSLTSRAYYTTGIAPLLEKLTHLSGLERGILMNTGAEAVETAIKAARRWGYRTKGIPHDQATIITAKGNFHGRTTTIISFSTEEAYQKDFGPLTPGFTSVPFGDLKALETAITPNTCAFLVEPIQGEGGIVMPPTGYLKKAQALCHKNRVLFILDEIQTGLARTGKTFAYQHEDVQPDGLILGKALGGGLMPVSAFLSSHEVLKHLTPGSHGSTFGGNPLASAIALEALNIMEEEQFTHQATYLGQKLLSFLKEMNLPYIKDVRGRGLLLGVELDPKVIGAHEMCLRLMDQGLLSKDTHETVVRFAPPLVMTEEELDAALKIIDKTFRSV